MSRALPSFLLACALGGAPVVAQEATAPDKPDEVVKREETVVVTASKVESTLVNAPATMSVVSAEAIRNSAAQNYGDLLRSVPGMNVIQTSARDVQLTNRQATGTVATSQLALVDGRTIYLDFFGVILWDTIPLGPSEIKQIEVVRGPASAVWGANALTGVVNIITRTPRESQGTEATFSAGLLSRDAGSREGEGPGATYGAGAVLARAPNDRWAYKISAGYFHSDAFPRPVGTIPRIPDPRVPGAFVGGAAYPIDGPGAPGTAFENTGSDQPKVDLRADQELSGGARLSYSAGVAPSEGIVHTGIGPFHIEDGSYFGYGRVGYTRGSLKATAFVNVVDAKAPSLLATDPGTLGPLQLDFKTQSYDLEVGHSTVVGGRHILSYGGNVRRNNFEITLAPNGKDRTELGAYFQDEFFVGKFRLAAGGRVDKFGNLDDPAFSPRVTAMFKPSPAHAIRLSFNKAFRSPSVVNNFLDIAIVTPADLSPLAPFLPAELQPAVTTPFPLVVRAVGNQALKEESLTAYEVGYTGTFNDRTTLGLAFYVNDTDDNVNFVTLPTSQDPYTVENPPPGWVERGLPPELIGLLAQGGTFLPRTAFQYLNLGPLRNRGLEASLEHRFPHGLSAYVNYSWQDKPEVLDDPNPFPAEEIALPPTHRLNLGVSVDRRRYLASVAVNYSSRAFWSDVLTPEYFGYTGSYTLVNANVGVKWNGGKVITSLKGTNLTNEDIQQHVFGDILKRSVSAEVRVKL
jgi:outer membrane receptor protein involved in Fe transport